MIKNDFNYKWSKLFAAKRFNTNGNIILTPIEQQELLDDCDKLVKKLNMNNKDKIHNMASCMLSILDSLKLYDNDSLLLEDETLSEVMFRKIQAYNIDLNKELGFTHLKPVAKNKL